MDRQLWERGGEPRTPGVPSGSGWVWAVLLVGGSLTFLAYQRRPPTDAPSGGSPCAHPRTPCKMPATCCAKLLGKSNSPSKVRFGMTLALDPTPFILAGGSIKLPQPGKSNTVNMSAVGLHIVRQHAAFAALLA